MPVPNSMADLSTLSSSNFPTGTEAIGNSLDNYLRAHAAIIRSTNAISSASIAAASTTDIASSDGESVSVSGAATINSLGNGFAGCIREVRFSGSPTIVASSNIINPSGNISVSPGDVLWFRCISPGQWTLVSRVFNGGLISKSLEVRSGAISAVNTLSGGGIGASFASVDSFGCGFIGTTTAHPLGVYVNNARTALFRVGGGMELLGTAKTTGSASGFFQESRNNSSQVWANYVFNDVWRLDVAGTADQRITVDLAGNLTAAGNIVSNSDESLKRDWKAIDSDLVERMAGMKAGSYERIDSGEMQVGVSANSLEEFMPLAVSKNEDGIRSVAYGNAALVGVVALSRRVLDLEERIRGLE